jgi:S-adenosylmethionine decarboxylase proenzyme
VKWFLIFSCLLTRFLISDTQESYQFQGVHFLASYMDCDHAALTDIPSLRQTFLDAASQSGATVLGFSDYIFSEDGFTMVILLSESHASIHTYPEHNSCFIDLFTCGDKCSSANFAKTIKNYLHPEEVSEKILTRSNAIEEQRAD